MCALFFCLLKLNGSFTLFARMRYRISVFTNANVYWFWNLIKQLTLLLPLLLLLHTTHVFMLTLNFKTRELVSTFQTLLLWKNTLIWNRIRMKGERFHWTFALNISFNHRHEFLRAIIVLYSIQSNFRLALCAFSNKKQRAFWTCPKLVQSLHLKSTSHWAVIIEMRAPQQHNSRHPFPCMALCCNVVFHFIKRMRFLFNLEFYNFVLLNILIFLRCVIF